jgi:hypothetical protein
MSDALTWLLMEDDALVAECDVHIYKASGPGGQHRNKVSSAVRLRHRPSEVTAVANDSRSQHTNRRNAVRRLRVNIACRCRTPRLLDPSPTLPEEIASCFFVPTKGPKLAPPVTRKLQVGKKDVRFVPLAAMLLDWLDAAEGRLGTVAEMLGVTGGNITKVLQAERHLFSAAQEIRKQHGQKPFR